MEMYFVSWYLHNKNNGGWAFKVEGRYPDRGAALKAYHTLLSSYIGGTTYDLVTVMLTDAYGNKLESEYWEMPAEEE